MENELSRLEILIGTEKLNKIKNSHVAVIGVGGVGGYVVESLVRCGIGQITIVDNDIINISNLNRQIISLHSNIGEKKVDVLEKRILDINPNCKVNKYGLFLDETTIDKIFENSFDYVIDAIDTVNSKLLLIKYCKNNNIPIISSMGTGNKLNPLDLKVCDISKTHTCPLAKRIRVELKKEGIKKLKVVFSTEQPLKIDNEKNQVRLIGSTAFVPSSAGLIISSEVIKDLIN